MPKETELAPLLIHNWDELAAVEDSETHTLKIDRCCGWINNKSTNQLDHYLSTHTFYGSTFKESTKILQTCGFNVQLKNCDAQQA